MDNPRDIVINCNQTFLQNIPWSSYPIYNPFNPRVNHQANNDMNHENTNLIIRPPNFNSGLNNDLARSRNRISEKCSIET